jgi:hypothetical protein
MPKCGSADALCGELDQSCRPPPPRTMALNGAHRRVIRREMRASNCSLFAFEMDFFQSIEDRWISSVDRGALAFRGTPASICLRIRTMSLFTRDKNDSISLKALDRRTNTKRAVDSALLLIAV